MSININFTLFQSDHITKLNQCLPNTRSNSILYFIVARLKRLNYKIE